MRQPWTSAFLFCLSLNLTREQCRLSDLPDCWGPCATGVHESQFQEIKWQFEPAVPEKWCSPLAEVPPAEDVSVRSSTCIPVNNAPAIFLLLQHLSSAWNLEGDLADPNLAPNEGDLTCQSLPWLLQESLIITWVGSTLRRQCLTLGHLDTYRVPNTTVHI